MKERNLSVLFFEHTLKDARIVIDRISESSNEQVLETQAAYAAGYLRCAQDQMLITVDQWMMLADEIETKKHSWKRRQAY
ncbi:hypothetical protein KDL27_26220 [Pseudomonas syringae pv. syringae]|uniref:Uncharacterized protein n=1 Tax=Pseudomonas syringae pv. syringae TaxID=321 RepID=A0AB35K0U3_PSESY|nr:hypothetical protein [Pseudomonas syringae]MBI6809485.1 hypothetical protein [Pseudomonas syringae]MDC3739280.1 hypothetical protein [Pseudomonas syringae pv. syringae]POP72868.1 hypothetical protein CXB37_25230 [Pseudomonas syringae pv. syringae]